MYRYVICSPTHIFIDIIDDVSTWAEILTEEQFEALENAPDSIKLSKAMSLPVRTWATIQELKSFMENNNPVVPMNFRIRKIGVRNSKKKYVKLAEAIPAMYWKGDNN